MYSSILVGVSCTSTSSFSTIPITVCAPAYPSVSDLSFCRQLSLVFCFSSIDSVILRFCSFILCSALPLSDELYASGTMASADFSRFVVTARRLFFFGSPGRPPRISICSFALMPARFTYRLSEWISGFVLLCRLASCLSALYRVSVRQARVVPPASFRPCVTATPLPLAVRFPPLGCARDFHPLEHIHAAHTQKTRLSPKSLVFVITILAIHHSPFTIHHSP